MNEVTSFPTIVTRYGFSPIAPALWREDAATGLKFRDLSLDQASEGVFIGRHLRAGGKAIATDALIAPDCAFAFLFVFAGRVTMTEQGGEPVVLNALDTVTRHGAGKPVTFQFSQDAEIIEMRAAGDDIGAFGTGDGSWVVTRESEDNYVQGDGPRAYFLYRDLGVAGATGRRIHIHLVRSTKAVAGGTGWHAHSMGQLFYVLRGWADLEVERQQFVRMVTGDAMCISKGMKHNVPAFSDDYLVLEMCIPADYDTFDQPPA